MQYKTIILAMLQQQPKLHEQLRSTRQLMPTLEWYALELKESHDAWKETCFRQRPNSDPSQIASEALEMAIQELRDRLPCEVPQDE